MQILNRQDSAWGMSPDKEWRYAMGDNKDKQIIENDMAQALNVTDESAAHDATAKKLVANKAILAYILKYTMDEFADTPLKEIPKYIEGKPKISKIAVMQDHADIEDAEDSEDVEVELLETDEEEIGKLMYISHE